MKRYPNYKDSGVEWLGEIPETWEVKRNKFIFKEKKDIVGEKANEFTLLSLTLRGVIARDIENPKGKFPAEFNTYKIVEPNNLIFCLFDIDETPRTVGHASQKGMITGAYTIVDFLNNYYSLYFYYYYLSLDLNKRLKILYTGLRKVITRDTFFSIKSPVPPPEEQKAIAHFLDHKLEQIEQYIRNKKRLIELLNEQKTAIINRAVTKGINPNVPMKHSGIEWLGEIPAHWEVKKLNFMTKRIGDGIHSTPQYVDSSEYYFINGNNLVNGNIVINESTRCVSKEEFEKYNLNLDQDTLLLSINGTIGNVAFYKNESVILGKSAAYITLKSEIFRKFAYYFLISKNTKNSFLYEVTGTTIFNLSLKSIKNTFFPTPPPEEQKAIVFFIESQCAKIDFAIAQIEKEIELIQEYRTTLISDAVTGKIDVRGFDNSSHSKNSPKPPELATM